ncbi:MAG TPA: adenylyl-sulfate kinase [Nitrospira sp.]|nr:adenylyl-sulfate kinase [Nitrospira sp.]
MNRSQSFAVWLTGLPASGKSTIARELRPRLEALGLTVEVLESDAVRRILTPAATYSRDERDLFYRALAFIGERLVAYGVTVLFDATANRRAYRDVARSMIPRFAEVAVECPLAVCMQRDRKGTYRKGERGETGSVPGLQEPYESPLVPELKIDTVTRTTEESVGLIVDMVKLRFL